MYTIIFRADASIEIGTGHIMRCLTLAHALQNSSLDTKNITFICQTLPINIKKIIIDAHFNLIELTNNNWSQQSDAKACISILSKFDHIDLLIQDHYLLNKPWQQELTPYYTKLLVIDDLANREHIADFLLDQTFARIPDDYQKFVQKNCTLLIGESFILLRDEFTKLISSAKIKRKSSSNIKNILVSLGGMDPDNITQLVLLSIIQFINGCDNNFNVSIILGSTAPHLDIIKEQIKPYSCFTLHQDCNNMAQLMLNADIAIGASGSTAWERCYLGLPTISIEIADNQALVSQNLMHAGAIINIGKAKNCTKLKIINALNYLLDNPLKYTLMIEKCFSCCDGLGTQRVIEHMLADKLKLKRVDLNDVDITFKWQSNPEIRKYFHHDNPVTYQEHVKWFTQALNNPKRFVFLIIDNNIPVGVLRLDKQKNNELEISILVSPDSQGKKIATRAIQAIPDNLKNKTMHAYVHRDNLASHRLFTKSNFNKVADDHYILKPNKKMNIPSTKQVNKI